MQKLITISHLNRQDGSALIGAVALALVMAISGLGYLYLSINTARADLVERDESRAFWAAESGMLLGAKWLKDSANAYAAKRLSPGSSMDNIIPNYMQNGYNVEVNIIRKNIGVAIQSTALCSNDLGFKKRITRDAITSSGAPFDTLAFNHAMFSDGTLTGKAAGTICDAAGATSSIHSNNAVDFDLKKDETVNANVSSTVSVSISGKSGSEVQGHVCAPTITGKTYITGSWSEETVSHIPFPDIDLTPWYNVASANGQVYNSINDVPDPCNPPGGVVWVKGGGTVNNITINGSLIMEGEGVTFHATVNAPVGGFALACLSGEIKVNAGATINGLIYAKNGNFHLNGHSNICGQVLAKGTILANGTGDFTYSKGVPIIPGGGGGNSFALVTGSWQEINVTAP